jgi:hypothetical protein
MILQDRRGRYIESDHNSAREVSFEQIYSINKDMFRVKKLLEKHYYWEDARASLFSLQILLCLPRSLLLLLPLPWTYPCF